MELRFVEEEKENKYIIRLILSENNKDKKQAWMELPLNKKDLSNMVKRSLVQRLGYEYLKDHLKKGELDD